IWMSGLYISPDIDTLLYLFSGLLNTDKWWGIRGDSFETYNKMKKLGYTELLPLGDKDRATSIVRTSLLQQNYTLTEVTKEISKAYGINATILPMSDQEVSTYVLTETDDLIHYQEYWVELQGNIPIKRIIRKTRNNLPLTATPDVINAIKNSDGIIIGPSNPVTSISPILECDGVKDALYQKFTIAISPFIGDKPISGPASELMVAYGYEPNSYGTWKLYKEFVNLFVQDLEDQVHVPGAHTLDTIMTTESKAESLAWDILSYIPHKS
ncbi:MAG TPA: 2-phospho-L-lactate transferase, partial [Methanocorpusculum sp.]|nr:2-phospho-L-lactate transferase [Methanocorpusculum sp.]